MIDVEKAVAVAVNDVNRRFYAFVDREDLLSEAWVWVYSHQPRVRTYSDDENEKRAWYRLLRDVTMACERYARREKAEQSGYDPRDEEFYGRAAISAALPAVISGDYTQPEVERPEGPVARTDPAEGNNWLALVVDVARAWHEADLTPDERTALIARFVEERTNAEIAESSDVNERTVQRWVRSGIRKMSAYLGGENPYNDPLDDALRRRPGVHSETSGKNQELS